MNALANIIDRNILCARSEHQITAPFRATICASNGTQLIVLRWVSADADNVAAPTLYHAAAGGIRATRTALEQP